MKSIYIVGGTVLALLIGGSVLTSYLQSSSDPNVIASRGLHWHPTLTIYVKGERIEIPENIGVGSIYQGKPGFGNGGMAMTPMHTHDDVPVIHLEYQGVVRAEDITLGTFFETWGKDFLSFGKTVHMTVNGQENIEHENYVMRDKDMIELRYE